MTIKDTINYIKSSIVLSETSDMETVKMSLEDAHELVGHIEKLENALQDIVDYDMIKRRDTLINSREKMREIAQRALWIE